MFLSYNKEDISKGLAGFTQEKTDIYEVFVLDWGFWEKSAIGDSEIHWLFQ